MTILQFRASQDCLPVSRVQMKAKEAEYGHLLADYFSYDADSGHLIHLKTGGKGVAGSRAGWRTPRGYRYVKAARITFQEHRVAWFLHYGSFPEHEIDHINQVKDDNRIVNLRDATPVMNSANKAPPRSRSNLIGAVWSGSSYMAQIIHNKKRYYLGRFKTAEAAHEAYCLAARKFKGAYTSSRISSDGRALATTHPPAPSSLGAQR